MMDQFISNLLSSPEFATALLTLFVTVVGGAIGFVAKEVRALLKRKLSTEQMALLLKIAEQAVRVAEQTSIGEIAEEKKAEALRVAGTYLRAYGLNVSDAQLDAAIEAAVFSQLNQFRLADSLNVDDAPTDSVPEEEEPDAS